MNFVKLTLISGNKIRINMDLIESYGTIRHTSYLFDDISYVGKTYLCEVGMSEDNQPYIVEEAPEEIDLMVKALRGE